MLWPLLDLRADIDEQDKVDIWLDRQIDRWIDGYNDGWNRAGLVDFEVDFEVEDLFNAAVSCQQV